ncbi:MAG: glycerate kinase [Mariniphaga sp.]
MRILIAPNAMKGSITASEFAKAISEGLLLANPELDLVLCPLADGGDGTSEVLVNTLKGLFVPVLVTDPLGREIDSRFGWLAETQCAIIEMAEASGLKLLGLTEMNPMVASSRGTGELIDAALKMGAKKIIFGIGGSATVDGGIGMLKALGYRLLDQGGKEVSEGGNGLIEVSDINVSEVSPDLENCEIVIASDVVNPIFGDDGGIAVYGPQKGATPQMIQDLTKGFGNYVSVLEKASGRELHSLIGGGAAGGIAIPLIALLNARIVNGADTIMETLGILNELKTCDLVVTGEGCVDLQTANGKGAAAIAKEARKAGIPVIAIGGIVKQEASPLFNGVFSITNGPCDLEYAMKNAYDLTKKLSIELGKLVNIFCK